MKQTSVIKQGTLIIPAKLQMRIDNKEITRNIRQSIRFKYSAEQLQLYIMKKTNWTDQEFHSVNWEASRRAHNKIKSLVQQRFCSKWCHKVVPTAYIEHKRKEASLDTCALYE